MIDIDILFYFPAESDPIHFGHHNITDDEIGFLLQMVSSPSRPFVHS